MRRWKSSLLVILVVGVSLGQTSDSSVTPVVGRVGSKLACLCGGCRNTVANCPMLGCHYSVPARERVNRLSAESKSDEEIIQAFVRETGIQALAVPPATGFNTLVWIMPWAALGLGLAAIFWFVRRYSGRRAVPAGGTPEIDEQVLNRYRDNIEKDLSNLD